MKTLNLKKVAAVTALLAATSIFAAENKIELSAQVDSRAIVGFENLSTSSAMGSTFADSTLNSIDFGLKDPGTTHTSISRQVYVLTNNTDGVSMTLADNVNNGNLKHASENDEIQMNYKFDGSSINLGQSFSLTNSRNSGSSVGSIEFVPSATTKNMAAGEYSTTLSVTIAAN